MDIKSKRRQLKQRRLRNIALNSFCALLAISGAIWGVTIFLRHRSYEITNDAYIDQYIVPVNVRTSGYIAEVRFTEHQYVSKGDTLLIIDNREHCIQLNEARARLLDAEGLKAVVGSERDVAYHNERMDAAKISEAEARLRQCERNQMNCEVLLKKNIISQAQFDEVRTECEMARAQLKSLIGQKDASRSSVREKESRLKNADASILQRKAEVEMAMLNLSYTVVTAPFDGYMGRRAVEPGQYIQSGQAISMLTRRGEKWVTANYLESQIANIHIGQFVKITVDAFDGIELTGVVSAISDATGAKYSMIPTDNSAGNFVKVQQRIPVRIDFDSISNDKLNKLRAGMMVEVAALKII